MTDSHFGQRRVGPLPEIPVEGLVLWRLHSYEDEWWCTVENFADRLILRVHTPNDSRIALTEALESPAAVITRADELCAQYLTQGWKLRDTQPPVAERHQASAMMTIWFVGPGWEVAGVQCDGTALVSPAAIMSRPPLGRLLASDLLGTVQEALAAAAAGEAPVLYFKAIRDEGVDWRRAVLSREDARVRMDIFETTEAVAEATAMVVDLRT